MFELPKGIKPPEETEFDAKTSIVPFTYGALSHYKQRSKKPIAHQLIISGKVAGWITKSGKKEELFVGQKASALLKQIIKKEKLRTKAKVWSQDEFASVASKIPEAFPDQRNLATLGISANIQGDLPSQDIAALVEQLTSRPLVKGAFAFENGLLIHSAGLLPSDAKTLARESQESLSKMHLHI